MVSMRHAACRRIEPDQIAKADRCRSRVVSRYREKAPLPSAFAPSFSLRFVKILPAKQPIVDHALFVFTSRSDLMTSDATDLDETGEALITNDLSDETLEAAASGDGRRAITWAYCSNYWTCWPL